MELEKFCFCCKLQKGAFIWSILSSCCYFILLITTVSSDLFVKEQSTEIGNEASLHHDTYKTPFYWVFLISSTIHLISSICLCIGVWKKNHYVMLPWIIVNGIYLIPVAFVALVILLAAIPIFGPIYVWWCICSYYLKIQDDRTLFFQLAFEAN